MRANPTAPAHVNDNAAPGLFQGAPELQLRSEVLAFQDHFAPLQGDDAPLPKFTWRELERQLQDLAVSDQQREFVTNLLSATKKLAPFKPKELVLREVLLIAAVLQDEGFEVGLTG